MPLVFPNTLYRFSGIEGHIYMYIYITFFQLPKNTIFLSLMFCINIQIAKMYLHVQKTSVSFPYPAVGWSVVFDCGISWSYSIVFQVNKHMY